jgi:hypothetical protein
MGAGASGKKTDTNSRNNAIAGIIGAIFLAWVWYSYVGHEYFAPTSSAAPSSAAAIAPAAGRITLAQYNQVREGMILADVERIMGRKGQEITNSGGISTVGFANSDGTNATFTLNNGVVVAKGNVGLY